MADHQSIITKSAQETAALGQTMAGAYVEALNRGAAKHTPVYCLFGDLGSGKTTFVQGFAKGLGITSRLLSPTFIIVRRYQTTKLAGFFYHLDLYRLPTQKDLESIGIADILRDTDSCVVIEWAEKLRDFLPAHRTDISFSVAPSGHHSIRVTHAGI